MAVSGEATVGHIIGFLRLDADQYFRELSKAQAAADRLGGKRVDIKVDADTAKASSGLREVSTAMEKADQAGRQSTGARSTVAALNKVEEAAKRVVAAQTRLGEIRKQTNAKASSVLSAELAVTRAMRQQRDAIFATYDANIAASDAAVKATAAEREAAYKSYADNIRFSQEKAKAEKKAADEAPRRLRAEREAAYKSYADNIAFTKNREKLDSAAAAKRLREIALEREAAYRSYVDNINFTKNREKADERAAQMRLRHEQESAFRTYEPNIQATKGRDAAAAKAAKWAQDSAFRTYEDNIKAAKAADKAAESTGKIGTAGQRSNRGMRPLVTTLLALGPALGPLTGATVGLAGALGSMGAAGVVALLGVKREMDQGTTLGAQFSRQISDLKGEFHGLESTAANGALAPFTNMTRELAERMPFLNQSVNTFTNLLGSGSTSILTGVIDSLQTMEPLLVSAGIWVDKLLAKFAAVAAGGGLKGFTDYARSTLPLVTNTLENLVVAVVDLIRAFAPMGAGVLQVINDVSKVISGMPIGVLTALASTASAAFLGFQAWRGINAIVGGVVGVLKLMNTEMVISAGLARGLSVATAVAGAAIGLATILYARHAEAARQEQAAIDTMTDALVRSNGAIDENIRLSKAKEIQDGGWAKVGADAGVSLDVMTAAFLGNKDAIDLVTQKLLAYQNAGKISGPDPFAKTDSITSATGALNKLGGAQDVVTGKGAQLVQAMKASSGATAESVASAKDLMTAQRDTAAVVDLTKTAVDRSMSGFNQAGSVYGITGAALRTFTDGQRDAAAQAEAARGKMILESDAAGILKMELDKLNGKSIDAAEAQNRFDSSLANMSDHTTKTGKKIVLTTKNLHGMSAASVAIRGDLIGQVQSMEAVVEANGGMSKTTGKARQQLVDMRQQIIDNAVAHGHNRKAVTEFIDSLFKIPKKIPPTKLEVDKKNADAKLVALQKKLGFTKPIRTIKVEAQTQPALTALGHLNTVVTSMDGKTVTIKTRYVNEGLLPNGGRSTAGGQTKGEALPGYKPGRSDGIANANGNIFKAYANGGVESHVAQMAPAGAMRLWAEPETGGESYIPHSPAKRDRSLAIWEETGRILGANQTTTNNSPVNVAMMVVHDAADIQRKAREARRKKALGRRRSGQ